MNTEPINPYYSPEKLGLILAYSFDEPDMSYEYNTLCFFLAPNGRIYSAQDSGCSCPTPFEGYEGTTWEEVVRGMEHIGSVEQAEGIFNSWNKCYDYKTNRNDKPFLPQSELIGLSNWVKDVLKNQSN